MHAPGRVTSTRDRAGFSLVEMLIVVVIIGMLTLIAMPRIDAAVTRRDVAAAKSGLTNLFLRAKVAAVTSRRPTTVTVGTGSAYATLVTPGGTTQYVGETIHFDSTGVASAPSAGTIVFQATGLVTGGGTYTVLLSKRGVVDSVMVVGYGRVQ
jgi:prepilin-type N-terminal cleavage/methylation domain-containing protein